jgi:general secretion pathway protein K
VISNQRGATLQVVIWAMAIMAPITGVAVATARTAIRSAQVRILDRRAGWARRACESLLLSIDLPAGQGTSDSIDLGNDLWCRFAIRPEGTRLSLNAAPARTLGLVLGNDSLLDALLDWRDADNAARPSGAERDWYLAVGRPGPRNAPLRAIDELGLVRGFDSVLVARLTRILTVDSASHVSLADAPDAILAGLPGMSASAIATIQAERSTGRQVRTIDELLALLSPGEREPVAGHYAELAALTAPMDRYVATIEGATGTAVPRSRSLVTLQRSDAGLAIIDWAPLP